MSDPLTLWPDALAEHGDLRDRLVAAYAHPGRGYHDLRHLREVLEHVEAVLATEAVRGASASASASAGASARAGAGAGPEDDGTEVRAADRDAVVLAAWFHDAVYEGGSDDEERSAALAERELSAADAPPRLVGEVARLVRLTAGHRPAPGDLNGKVLCDADLAILAASRDRYRDYTLGVREEYSHLTDEEFREGRAAVLRGLVGRDRLFTTRYGLEHWEERARANIRRELDDLER